MLYDIFYVSHYAPDNILTLYTGSSVIRNQQDFYFYTIWMDFRRRRIHQYLYQSHFCSKMPIVQLQPEISVTQLKRGLHILELYQKLFGCGSISPKSQSSDVIEDHVHNVKQIVEIVIPWIETYVLPSSGKTANFVHI